MLALAEYEAPDVPPDHALAVYADFLALPQVDGVIDAGFQPEVVAEAAEEGQLSLILGVRYPLPPIPSLREEEDTIYRSVGIRWHIPVTDPGRFESNPVWVADCADLTEFVEAVRATPEWRQGQAASTWQCDVFAEDD